MPGQEEEEARGQAKEELEMTRIELRDRLADASPHMDEWRVAIESIGLKPGQFRFNELPIAFWGNLIEKAMGTRRTRMLLRSYVERTHCELLQLLDSCLALHEAKQAVSPQSDPAAPSTTAYPVAAPVAPQVHMNVRSVGDDRIILRIETRDDGRLMLCGLKYHLLADALEDEDEDIQFCLSALELEWDWQESLLVELGRAWRDDETRLSAVRGDNPDIRIRAAEHDSGRFVVTVSDKERTRALITGRSNLPALRRVVLPEAKIETQTAQLHKFTVKARKGNLCLARREGDGALRIMERGSPEVLAAVAEALADALAVALVEVAGLFPHDGGPLVLGVREAEPKVKAPLYLVNTS